MILLNNIPLEIQKFPNGESRIEKEQFSDFLKNSIGRPKVILKYESDSDLLQLLLVRKALWFPVELHIPYFPYSRMDRKSESHVFTLKSVAKYINWLDFEKVYIYEPHSDVTPALLNKCSIVSLIPNLLFGTDFDIKKDCVLYPDATAYKHYSDLIKSPLELIGIKKREFATGKIKELHIAGDCLIEGEELANKRVFIIDDLCSKGGTFLLAAEKLKAMGAGEINLVVAHCEASIFLGKLAHSRLIKNVYTTDSIINTKESNLIDSWLQISSLTSYINRT